MESVVLVIHLFLALAIIGLVLIQRSEGGGLGIGGGGGGLGGLATPRGAANLLTRLTAVCAIFFFATSLILGIMAGQEGKSQKGLLETLGSETQAPVSVPEKTEEPSGNDPKKEGDPKPAPVHKTDKASSKTPDVPLSVPKTE